MYFVKNYAPMHMYVHMLVDTCTYFVYTQIIYTSICEGELCTYAYVHIFVGTCTYAASVVFTC